MTSIGKGNRKHKTKAKRLEFCPKCFHTESHYWRIAFTTMASWENGTTTIATPTRTPRSSTLFWENLFFMPHWCFLVCCPRHGGVNQTQRNATGRDATNWAWSRQESLANRNQTSRYYKELSYYILLRNIIGLTRTT